MTAHRARSSQARRRGAPPLIFALMLAIGGTSSLAEPATARPFGQRDLLRVPRVGAVRGSPDGHRVAFDVTTLDEKNGRARHEVWTVATDGSAAPVRLADGGDPRWGADGHSILYLVDGQLWSACPDCAQAAPRQVTHLPAPILSYRLARDGSRLVFAMRVFPGTEDPAHPGPEDAPNPVPGANGRLYSKLMVRHWDQWEDGRQNHLFSLALAHGEPTGSPVPLMKGFNGECPPYPASGDDDFTIRPDGRTVVFSSKLATADTAWSTNFDLYSVPVDGGAAPSNLTVANLAWDAGPTFSPDGRYLAYRAMTRPTFEADRFDVMLLDLRNRSRRKVASWDRSPSRIEFSGDGRSLLALALDRRQAKVFRIDIASGDVRALTGEGRVSDFDVARGRGGDLVSFARDSMTHPPEVFAMRGHGTPVQLTHLDDPVLAGADMVTPEPFSFAGWNGDKVDGVIFKPNGWEPGGRYPTVLLIHGGPEASWYNGWSPLWNPQVWAGWGYAVVMIDPHGSTGYGQAFTDSVTDHWGDRPLEDLQKGWAAATSRFPWIDAGRACAGGPSYGGYMAYWMEGTWDAPWKCLIAHDGIFDNRMMGYATDELWAIEWENGGAPPWRAPGGYERFNPINGVARWHTPMLVVHSDRDFRIPLDQGLGAFSALQRRGIPSEFLQFTDEGHRVVRPQDLLQWHDTVKAWLDRWIGDPPKSNSVL